MRLIAAIIHNESDSGICSGIVAVLQVLETMTPEFLLKREGCWNQDI